MTELFLWLLPHLFFCQQWHLGHTHSLPTQRGFDHFFGIPYSHDMTGEHVGVAQVPVANRAMPPLPLYRDTDVIEQPTNLEVLGERLADAAVDFLEKQAQSDQPFFLLLAFYQPHVPIVPSPKFRGTSLRGPYGDFVQELDAGVGKVMAALKKHGLVDNTLVHFTSGEFLLTDGLNKGRPKSDKRKGG